MSRTEAKDSTLRLFTGIACPSTGTISALLDELQNSAAPYDSGIRVVAESNLHVTLKFFGSVAEARIADITKALDKSASASRPFAMTLAGAGVFNDAFWLGLLPCEQLAALAKDLNRQLEAIGFAAERRPFVPHLTVARTSQRSDLYVESLVEKYRDVVWGGLEVDCIHLFQSTTLPSGIKYSILHTAGFPPI